MDKSPDAFRTISEVSDWLDTPAHVLRFWESRFTQLKPVKRAGGRRYYRPGDMALLGGIKKLLHDDGLTIRGVQKILREQGVRFVATLGPDTVAAGDMPVAPRTADIVLDEAEYGTPETIAAWQQDGARDQGRPAPLADAPEAPMHVDAPEISDAPQTAALYSLRGREALAEIPAEELADLEMGLTQAEDMAIPPELEGEWAAILAEEAAARALAGQGAETVQPELFSLDEDPPAIPATEPATPVPAPQTVRTRPARSLPADIDPAPGPPPLASLLRHVVASKSLTQAAQLRPFYARLIQLRKQRNQPAAPDRQ